MPPDPRVPAEPQSPRRSIRPPPTAVPHHQPTSRVVGEHKRQGKTKYTPGKRRPQIGKRPRQANKYDKGQEKKPQAATQMHSHKHTNTKIDMHGRVRTYPERDTPTHSSAHSIHHTCNNLTWAGVALVAAVAAPTAGRPFFPVGWLVLLL